MPERLCEDNFLLYAAKNYENPQCCDTVEFYDDLKRFKYIKRLIKVYIDTGELRERLILNHIIILYNLFGPEPTTRMLFFKLHGMHSYLKPFIELLNFLPKEVINIGVTNTTIKTADIISNTDIVERLRKI